MKQICPKCNLINNTLQWWFNEKTNTAVCYPCAMNRREEQNKIDKHWIKQYGTKTSAQASVS